MNDTSHWETQSLQLLVIEDSPHDLELLRLAIERNSVDATLHTHSTGHAGLRALATEPLPDVVLLDLRLPDMDGIDVLRQIKRHPSSARIPVVILSGSSDPTDIQEGYAQQASAYLQKPTTAEGWQALVRSFSEFWLQTVLLPKL